ncbi:MAG: alkaline phosphatase family protein [Candidatus Bathyarchaeota archaeon]
MKLIYVVIDGMGDLPVKELGNKTPLAVADTPNMSSLTKRGKSGLMYTVGKGYAPESDAGVVSILGYDPLKYNASRGVMEAVGSGMVFKEGDLALRCNFATLGLGGKIIDRRAGRDLKKEETVELSKEINTNVKLTSHPSSFNFKNTTGHRGVLVIRGRGISLSGSITNTDPAYMRVGEIGVVNTNAKMVIQRCESMDDTKEARFAAELVNEFLEKSHSVLENSIVNRKRSAAKKLIANGILTRDAGHRLPSFFSINKRYNVRFCCLADMPLEIGIARLTGMNVVNLPHPSGDLAKDCEDRVKRLCSVLKSYDCFYIHIKGPDEPGHDGDCSLKKEMISTIDEHFFGSLLPRISLKEIIFCVTADHATPCKLKAHSDDPVPILISGNKIQGDGGQDFSESSCEKGSLGLIDHGYMIMPKLMAYLKQS